ncbi:MAG: hypothetical protein K2J80_06515 [Oscillospiraceae bacterium]|nr:hypothetical protein [Oscillospiraceae bacterium]
MEKLAALFIEWVHELCAKETYFAELDRLILENPEDNLLLELETLCSAEDYDIWGKFWSALEERITDRRTFEKELFNALGSFYDKYCMPDGERDEIWARFGNDWESREDFFKETGKITLWQFCERCFELGDSLDIDHKLKNVLMMPHYSFENMDRYAGEFPQTDEEIIEEIRQTFRKTFDFYKEKK